MNWRTEARRALASAGKGSRYGEAPGARPTGAFPGLCGAVLGSIGVHLAVMVLWSAEWLPAGDDPVIASAGRVGMAILRVERPPAVAAGAALAGTAPVVSMPAESIAERLPRGLAASPVSDTGMSAPTMPPSETESAEPAMATAPLGGAEPLVGYLPREALSVPPAPRDNIDLAWPPGIAVAERQSAVFTVFIDETGRVRQMVPDGPTLLPSLEASARATFMAAPFSPGEIDGRPVRSMVRIEVVFDGRLTGQPNPAEGMPVVVSRQNL